MKLPGSTTPEKISLSRFLLWAIGVGVATAIANLFLIQPLVGGNVGKQVSRVLMFFLIGYFVLPLIPAATQVPRNMGRTRLTHALIVTGVAGLLMLFLDRLWPASREHEGGPSSVLEELASHYAPGVALGGRLSLAESHGYHLQPAPYVGWQDTTYLGPEGVSGLRVRMDQALADETSHPSPSARVRAITLGLPSEGVRVLVHHSLSQAMGEPTIYCRRSPLDARAQLYYWERGVLIVESRAEPPRDELAGSGSTLTIGPAGLPAPTSSEKGACRIDEP